MVHVESMIQEDATVCTRSAENSLAFMRLATRAAEAQELHCVPHRGAVRGLPDRQKSGIIFSWAQVLRRRCAPPCFNPKLHCHWYHFPVVDFRLVIQLQSVMSPKLIFLLQIAHYTCTTRRETTSRDISLYVLVMLAGVYWTQLSGTCRYNVDR